MVTILEVLLWILIIIRISLKSIHLHNGFRPTVKRGTYCGMDSFRELTGSESLL